MRDRAGDGRRKFGAGSAAPLKSRLRILHIVKGLGPGGAERLLCSAAAVRDRDAFDYDVAYVLPWKNHVVPELTRSGVAVHCLGTGKGTLRVITDPRWALRLNDLLRSQHYDVVHLHSPMIAGVVRPMVRALGRRRPKLVSTEHNGWATYALPTRLVNRLTYRLDDAQFAVSEQVRSSVSKGLRPRVEVTLHGVRVDEVRAMRGERETVRMELGLGDAEIVVGTVANYLAQKAYPDLFAAARIALDADPRLRFVSVGQGQLEAEIRAEHHRLRLGERFRLLGYRPDAVRVMAGCDVFTLASHYEGFPVALMEALALGRPVVVTAVGGIPDAVTDGREGFLVPPGRPEQLADAILRLARDTNLRTEMGEAAFRLGSGFDIRNAVHRMEQTYAALADSVSSSPAGG
jgi:L-malate glycosyltransferase